MRCLLAAVLLAPLLSLGAETELSGITVTNLKDPVSKSYRKMLSGMDLFEEQRALAPQATLRYKLLPRKPDTRLEGIQLGIIGETVAIPVRVARDGTFTLERDRKALQEDAAVSPNRRAASMTWRTEIRTPGLPPDTRRLGDLRLECEVGMEADLVSNEPTFFSNALRRRMGYCKGNPARYLYFTERPVFGVTLVHGERRVALPAEELYAGWTRMPLSKAELLRCDCEVLLDRTYFLPLGDAGWPDDTLVQFEYMEDGAAPRNVGKADYLETFGKASTVAFDNGYEVWVYRAARSELVVLFNPAGAALKSRSRKD